jgi:2-polyprenyl-3-methyl-5-hydroxy-6-metoxy-1,4-benzoquinol methylase
VLPPWPRAQHAAEHLDGSVPLADRSASLTDVARLNGLFGGRLITVTQVRRLLARLPSNRVITILDVGTGGADIPMALVRWARRAGRRLRVLALDRDRPTLDIARRAAAGYPEIALLQGDALDLPVRPRSVDLAISALTLHHLEPDEAVRFLAQLDDAARAGVVVNDLMRSRAAYAMVWLATRVLARHWISRHDGPLSVRRAYTPPEVRALCQKAAMRGVCVWRYPLLARQCAVRGAR